MRPDARVQAAIEVIDQWRESSEGLDHILARWGRSNRYAGSKDRHAIADLVYDAVRRWRSALWVAGAEKPSGRAAMVGALSLNGASPEEFFTGERHAPAPLADAERATRDLDAAPLATRFDVPDWLLQHLDGIDPAHLLTMRDRAPLDLRVNTLRASRAEAMSALATDGIEVEAGPLSDLSLRVVTGQRRVARSSAYLDGLVEIQDAASLAVTELAEPKPGETILDLCAGGGGKSLALAAMTGNCARIAAYDISRARLANLPDRARRAGAQIETLSKHPLERLEGACDVVFIDAPCSGMGAWRRNPDAKWRLTADRLDDLIDTQSRLLDEAVALVRPGGRIVFATCSMLDEEGPKQVQAFQDRTKGWEVSKTLRTGPADKTDGFFGAVLNYPKS